jgi:hypothetical protein
MSVAAVVAASVPLPFVPARRDPLRKSRGWEVLADSVAAATARQSQAPGRWHLAANRYQDAALLQWHLTGHPEVTSLNLGGRPNQYDLWPRFAEAAAPGDGLLLALPERADAATVLSALRPHFDRLEEGPLVEQRWRESVVRRHRLWLLHGWRGSWPVSPGTVPPAPRPG